MSDAKPTHNDIYERLGEIISKLELHDGQLSRIEAKVLAYDRLKERVIGAFMALSVALAAFWWLTKDRWGAFFGVHSGS